MGGPRPGLPSLITGTSTRERRWNSPPTTRHKRCQIDGKHSPGKQGEQFRWNSKRLSFSKMPATTTNKNVLKLLQYFLAYGDGFIQTGAFSVGKAVTEETKIKLFQFP